MGRRRDARETVLKASRDYYAHRAYYEDLLVQRQRQSVEATKRELNFLEHAFRADVTCSVHHIAPRGSELSGMGSDRNSIHVGDSVIQG
jgi:hypothetical protein